MDTRTGTNIQEQLPDEVSVMSEVEAINEIREQLNNLRQELDSLKEVISTTLKEMQELLRSLQKEEQ